MIASGLAVTGSRERRAATAWLRGGLEGEEGERGGGRWARCQRPVAAGLLASGPLIAQRGDSLSSACGAVNK